MKPVFQFQTNSTVKCVSGTKGQEIPKVDTSLFLYDYPESSRVGERGVLLSQLDISHEPTQMFLKLRILNDPWVWYVVPINGTHT